jgi:3-dehydroquinate synthetase
MVAAARISEVQQGFSEARRITQAIDGLGLQVKVTGVERARLIDLLGYDKKRDITGLRMVLLNAIGSPMLARVDERAVDIGLAAIGL